MYKQYADYSISFSFFLHRMLPTCYPVYAGLHNSIMDTKNLPIYFASKLFCLQQSNYAPHNYRLWLCYRQKHTINRLQQECREYEARMKQLLLNRSLEEAGVIGIRLQVSVCGVYMHVIRNCENLNFEYKPLFISNNIYFHMCICATWIVDCICWNRPFPKQSLHIPCTVCMGIVIFRQLFSIICQQDITGYRLFTQ